MKTGKRVLALLLATALLGLTVSGCGTASEGSSGSAESGSAALGGEAPQNVAPPEPSKLNLSAGDYDFDANYFYDDYNAMSRADMDRQDGIDTFEDTDIVFRSLNWEQLVYLLQQEGNYLILLGGSWCHNTRAAIGYVNDLAHEYGITTIYNFDFRVDGSSSDTHIRVSNGDSAAAAPYNYLYGELVSRFLTNLTDWVEYTEDSESALTYTNSEGVDTTVAKVQVPFLFLYNRDNTVDNSGKGRSADRFPIVFGFEEMVDRDSKGVYVYEKDADGNPVQDADGNNVRSYITDAYLERLRGVFNYIRDNGVVLSEYSDGDYLRQAFNEQAQAQIGQDLFAPGDEIAYNVISYRQLDWLLRQEGNALILLGGPWCGNTRALVNTINDYALVNQQTVYFADLTLDGGYARSAWGYEKDLQVRASDSPLVRLYTDLVEKYLTNLVTLYDVNADEEWQYIAYTDEDGAEVRVRKLQVPYLLSYNRDAVDEDGFAAPVTGYYEKMLTLDPKADDYVYSGDNYEACRAGVKAVLEACATLTGDSVKDIEVDRSAS